MYIMKPYISQNLKSKYKKLVERHGHPTVEKLISKNGDIEEMRKIEHMLFMESSLKLDEYIISNNIISDKSKEIELLYLYLYDNDVLIKFIEIAPHCLCNYNVMNKLTPEELKHIIKYSLNYSKHKYFLKYCIDSFVSIADIFESIKLSYLDGYRMYKLDNIPTLRRLYDRKKREYVPVYVKYNFIMQFLSTYKKIKSTDESPIARFYKSPIFDINSLRIIFKFVLG